MIEIYLALVIGALPYIYVVVRIATLAYFKSRSEYNRKMFNNFIDEKGVSRGQ